MPEETSPPSGRTCPACNGKKVFRSHRRGFFERAVLPLIGRRPYRCHDCGHRFYASRFGHPGR